MRETQKVCLSCGKRKALFRFKGRHKTDRHHDLCFQCQRSVKDATRDPHDTEGTRWTQVRVRRKELKKRGQNG